MSEGDDKENLDTLYILNAEQEQKQIKRLRRRSGLRDIVKKQIRCLRCSEFFDSEDVSANRMCTQCLKFLKKNRSNWVE